MSVTIKDVAKQAGVSTATISRYLNDSPFISQETAEKVRATMMELNYSPNSMARSLVNQITHTVAFIVDSQNSGVFGNPYFLQIQYGIEKVLGNRGFYLMIVDMGNRDNGENVLHKLISEKRVDGVILPSVLSRKSTITKIIQNNFPCVIFGKQKDNTNVSWVDLDNVMGGRLAAEHLIKNGCRRIAFVGCDPRKVFGSERLEGYKKALMQNGLNVVKDLIMEGCEGKEKGFEVMKEILSRSERPDGIIFSDNFAAFGAVSAVGKCGIRVPEDIQVVSFDDGPAAVLCEPEMTVVDIDMFDLGSQAATMLLKQIEAPSGNIQQSLISVKLICRGTSRNVKAK